MALTTRCLVTGGAGFIGSNLAEELLARGAKVNIIDNLSTGSRYNLGQISGEFDFVEGDLNDDVALKKAVRDVDVVFHQAALPSVPRSVEDPVATHEACASATLKLLCKAKELGISRFIYAASSSAYGDKEILPKVETMTPEPLSPYAAAKLIGEHYCRVFHRVYGLRTISLRYFNVFGPRQDPSSAYSGVISRFIDSLMRNDQPVIYGDGTQSRDFTYISNVVDANFKAAEVTEGFGEVYNTANGDRISLNELFGVLADLTGKNGIKPLYDEPRKGDVMHSQADNRRAVEVLGYENKVGLKAGLRRTIDWWRQSRYSE